MAEEKKTILIVEDNPLSLKLAVDVLQLAGFNTISSTDGESALDALKTTSPDLILLDIGLPGMSGFEVYQNIKNDPRLRSIKVIAVSASVMKEDEEKIKAAGFSAFIPKPIDIKDFIKKIKGALGLL